MSIDRFSPAGLAASGTEHGEQAALFAWAERAKWLGVRFADDWGRVGTTTALHNAATSGVMAVPDLEWLHAVPNGGERGRAAASNMKAEGVKSGVADIFWPITTQVPSHVPTVLYGLYIEMKRKNGRLSDCSQRQRDFARFVVNQGYAWRCCFGWEDARQALINYANGSFVQQPLHW